MSLLKSRHEAVAIARSWIGTPYVKGARIRGAGCDCATLLAEYLIEIGAANREELGAYSHDWFSHTSQERYMIALIRHARQTMETVAFGSPEAAPGNLVLYRVVGSRVYNHGAIVVEWPRVVHAYDTRVGETDTTLHPLTANMQMAVFDPFEPVEQINADR